jgi:hypothetical protein
MFALQCQQEWLKDKWPNMLESAAEEWICDRIKQKLILTRAFLMGQE